MCLLVAPGVLRSQPVHSEIDTLAQFLAGSASSSSCRWKPSVDSGPAIQDCVWSIARATTPESLTVSRYPNGASLTWDHTVRDSAAARQFIDSLAQFATTLKLARRSCGASETPAGPASSTLWSSEGLIVFVTHFSPGSAAHRVLIVATDSPEDFPTNRMCGSMEAGQDTIVRLRRT